MFAAALLAGTFALPISAACMDADATTIAIGRDTPRGAVIETSTAGGPWEPALGPARTLGCPSIAAADDGTVVVAADDNLTEGTALVTIRRPGGTFGPPVSLNRSEGGLKLAAAPGGTVAVLWQRWHSSANFAELNALVVPPSGPATRTRLPRTNSSTGWIDVALAPGGTATAVWMDTEPLRKRYAEFRAGRWTAAVDLYAARREGWWDSGVELAQAPNGRRLMAWTGEHDLRVDVEGQPTTVVAEPGSVDSIAGALADDGSAVVVFQRAMDLFAVDRGPDGVWSKPRRLSLPAHPLPDFIDGARASVVSGGRVLVTWPLADGRVVAVSGHAGGRWGLPMPVSVPQPPPEDPDVPLPRLVDGRIVWVEQARRRHPDEWSPSTLRTHDVHRPLGGVDRVDR